MSDPIHDFQKQLQDSINFPPPITVEQLAMRIEDPLSRYINLLKLENYQTVVDALVVVLARSYFLKHNMNATPEKLAAYAGAALDALDVKRCVETN